MWGCSTAVRCEKCENRDNRGPLKLPPAPLIDAEPPLKSTDRFINYAAAKKHLPDVTCVTRCSWGTGVHHCQGFLQNCASCAGCSGRSACCSALHAADAHHPPAAGGHLSPDSRQIAALRPPQKHLHPNSSQKALHPRVSATTSATNKQRRQRSTRADVASLSSRSGRLQTNAE